eukprot:COSAG01_NODE_79897_length_125_cov_48.846154_1_plen_23_part_10
MYLASNVLHISEKHSSLTAGSP